MAIQKSEKYSGARKHDGRLVLDLERHVPYFFTVISIGLSRGASSLYRRLFGIGITEWRVMGVLAGTPGVTANMISAAIAVDKAAVSRSIRTLEKMKLIKLTQIENDYRSKTIKLSAAGIALHDKVITLALERENVLLGKLSEREQEAFIQSLRKLRAAVPEVNRWKPLAATNSPRKRPEQPEKKQRSPQTVVR